MAEGRAVRGCPVAYRSQRMIKYIGSKRRLVPVLGELATALGARHRPRPLHGHDARRAGAEAARDARDGRRLRALRRGVRRAATWRPTRRPSTRPSSTPLCQDLAARPGVDGYVTETFCVQSRFFQPFNGRRIDAIRDAIEADYSASPLVSVAAHQPDRGRGPGRLHDRRADGVREAVGAALVSPARVAGARAAGRRRATRCGATRASWPAGSARSTSPTSIRRTTSTGTSPTTTSGRRWSRGTRRCTTAWRASVWIRAIPRRTARSTSVAAWPTRWPG